MSDRFEIQLIDECAESFDGDRFHTKRSLAFLAPATIERRHYAVAWIESEGLLVPISVEQLGIISEEISRYLITPKISQTLTTNTEAKPGTDHRSPVSLFKFTPSD
jgi:hypothetical protein